MFEGVYKKTHPATIALAKVRLVLDYIANWGTVMLMAVVLPPTAQLVTPMGGKMNFAKVHIELL